MSALVACAVAAPQFGGRSRTPAYTPSPPAYTTAQAYNPPAAPRAAPKDVLIVKQAQDVYHDGTFSYKWVLSATY